MTTFISQYWTCLLQVFVISGGFGNNNRLSSTEILIEGTAAWTAAGDLPSARYGLTGASVDSSVLMLGGWGDTYLDTILRLDPDTLGWEEVGHMASARSGHGVTTLAARDIVQYCG